VISNRCKDPVRRIIVTAADPTKSFAPVPASRQTVGWILLGCLLALRLPYFTGVSLVLHGSPLWLVNSFEISTYVITALLIYWERDRLALFHIDRLALGLYLVAPLPLVSQSLPALSQGVRAALTQPYVYHLTSVVVLGLALLPTYRKLPRVRRETWVWLGVAVIGGSALSAVFGVVLRRLGLLSGGAVFLPQILYAFMLQLSAAASLEEPLFRGFLFGYLRERRWSDTWICVLQAGLFALGHAYYWGHAWFSLLVVVPVSALFFGWVAIRSRSIGATMTAHGITNSLHTFFAQFHW
jgi:membrane protease YdiL (CAAX protease family)